MVDYVNIVTFDYTAWTARYPEFSVVPDALAQEYFNEATIYWDNSGRSRARTKAIQSTLLNMLTAHIAAMYTQSAGDAQPGQPKPANSPVGAINSASEGSVSVGMKNDYPPGTPQWYQQTKYGSSFWAATAQYRTMVYVAPVPTVPGFGGPNGPFFRRSF